MASLPKLSDNDKAILHSIFNPNMPFEDPAEEESALDFLDGGQDENADVQKLELEAINCAENENIEESLALFTKCIELSPNRAATYNNRSQVYLLKGDIESSLNDLDKALSLCEEHGRVARQAFCQKGIIYKKQNDNEKALDQFRKAAKLGNAFAKEQLVKMNPYAALCNQMLNQVLPKLK